MPKRNYQPSSRSTLAKLAFFTFIAAAIAFLVQAILARLNFSSNIMHAIQSVVIVFLFAITGVLGWKYCRTRAFLIKIFYFICVAIILIAVILPII